MNKIRLPILLISIVFFISLNDTSSSANDTYSLKESDSCLNPLNSNVPMAYLTYNIMRVDNPNKDEISAYRLLKQVMDSAVFLSNAYTKASQKITVYYVTSKGVRADSGGSNGKIRFGPERTYMNVGTALHEISHVFGVGTSNKWISFMAVEAPTGKPIFKGKNATNMLRQITGDKNAVIFMDNLHFWPYGLNYVSEYKTESDLINHCKIVNAMIKDGL